MIKNLLLLFFILGFCSADNGKFIILTGPSGAGKSTIISELKKLDNRFSYVTPLTTRPLREGETDKVSISLDEMNKLSAEGKLLTINKIYDIYYGTPKNLIDGFLKEEKYAILDWPIEKISILKEKYPYELIVIYIKPEGISELKERLSNDTRDLEGKRLAAGKDELIKYEQGIYNKDIDFHIINNRGQSAHVASEIYDFIQKKN